MKLNRIFPTIVYGISLLASTSTLADTIIKGTSVVNPTQSQTNINYGSDTAEKPTLDVEPEYPTPKEEFHLPDRLREYEMPEAFNDTLVNQLNDAIPTVINTVRDRLINNQPVKKVIGDNPGNTVPLSSVIDLGLYYDTDQLKLDEERQKVTARYLRKEVSAEEVEEQLTKVVFPVRPSIKPSRMPASRMELPADAKDAVPGPMVFIGMDDFSLEWFQMNLAEIRRFSPVAIFVTQIETLVDLRQLQRLAPDMKFVPVNSQAMLEKLGVEFYPVMITPDGIFQ